ncbi:MAG: efflux RND transporter periplasmic adaptor subunit [Flavobacteriales bacterium]|jgi:RND family efflux transporter MFP subunit|nr:efflux RND transporter periplasmic adaptor subunit [Flavobacteriales bacterium]
MKTQQINSAFARILSRLGGIPQFLLLLLLTVAIASCGGAASGEEEGHGGHDEHGEEGGSKSSVTIEPVQFANIEGKLGTVELKDLNTALKATGFLKVPPQNMADITAAMGGTVREVLVQEGDAVRKGQPLVTIADPAIIDLQRDYIEAKARLTYSTADLARQQELADANVAARKTLQQATAENASLKATVTANAQLLRMINIDPYRLDADGLRSSASIVSPIDGTVAHIGVNVGTKVTGDAALMRVVNNGKLHVDVFLYEQDIAKVKVGQNIDLTLTNLPGRTYTAKVFAIGSAFESETKTIPVHAEITGERQGLIDGMGVTARIDVGNAKVTAVLTDAIVNYMGVDYVFIRTDGEEAHVHAEEAEHKHAEGDAHDHAAENKESHASGEEHAHDHDAEPAPKEEEEQKHAEGEAHDHAAENKESHAQGDEHAHDEKAGHEDHAPVPGSMTFKKVQVKRGTTDGAYTAVTFMEPVEEGAEVVVGGAFYIIAMMNTSSGHQH